MRRMTIGFLVALAALVALWAVAVFGLQRKAMYPAPPARFAIGPPADAEVLRVGPDGVEAWLLPPLDAEGSQSAADPDALPPALLFFHGNGELIDFWPDEFAEPRLRGWAVLLVEYPGYGRSGGSPSEESIVAAALAAHDALAARDDVDPARLVAYGRSLGGGAAAALAARRPSIAALVLESSFTGVAPLARRFLVPGSLVLDRFDNLAALAAYDGPVLIVHGKRDAIVPPSHARALHEAAPGSELVWLPHGHNDMPRAWPEILGFLER